MPIKDIKIGTDVQILHPDLVNLYGCEIGDETKIGTFVEIQRGARIGPRCKISSHSFICEGVTIEEGVFVGHGVMFTNDLWPRAVNEDGTIKTDTDWVPSTTLIRVRASIGSGAAILAGITIGIEAMIGAGAVVIRDVPDHAVVAGNPARMIADTRNFSPPS